MKWIDKKYEIIRSLGGGAFSDVYLVESPEGTAALKLLKTEITLAPTEKNLICFKNEFSILKNLNHPNIARILDFGLDEELLQYYFTTEFVEGTDIFTGTAEADIDSIIALFVQALRSLEYLHSYRIFHFDIKAANVLVTKEKKVKLIDFGLASLDPKGKLIGTPSYMSPEIVRKEKPDGRADIYSLGVLWYYCLARKNPFRSGDPKVTLENQKSMIPPPPSKYNPKIPQYIDQIIARMLEKRPQKRYERAAQIIKEINLLGGQSFDTETSETLLSYIPEKGRFIGRKKEINKIKEIVSEIKEKKTDHWCLLVTGKTGTGKKRLLDEMRYYSQLNDISVEAADGHNIRETEQWLEKIDEHLKSEGHTRTFLIHSIEWLEATPPIIERIKNILSKVPVFSKAAPTLLALAADEKSTVAGDLQPLVNDQIKLENFNREELQEYIVNLTGLQMVPEFLVQEIMKRTEGNPLFVTEISKSLITSGALFDTKGRWRDTSFVDLGVDFKTIFPESLKDLLMDSYYEQEAEEKKVLECLAIAGRPCSSFELSAWTETSDISEPIENLVRADILTRQTAYEYFFRNELLAGYIYDDLPELEREKYHDKIAEHLIQVDGSIDEIVKHIGYGSDYRMAFEKTFEAGNKYLKEGLGKKAIEYLTLAKKNEGATTIEEKIELNMKLGEAHLISQNYKNALHYFNAAEDDISKAGGKEANAAWHVDNLIKIGGTYVKLRELDKAKKSFAAGEELLRQMGEDRTRELLIENFEGYLALQEGNIEAAENIFSRTRKIWVDLPGNLKSQVTNNELGMVLLEKGDTQKAVEVLNQDLAYFQEIKDELLIARRFYNLALAHQLANQFKEATKYFEETAELSRKTRDIELLFCAYNGLGNIYNITSQLEKSREYYERARGLSFQSGDFKSHAAISINIGIIENKLGNTDLAYYELYPAIVYLKNAPKKSVFDWQILSRGQMEMTDILIKRSDFEGAEKVLENAKHSSEHIPGDETSTFWLLLTEAELHKEKGSPDLVSPIIEKLRPLAKTSEEKEAIARLEPFREDEMESIYRIILEINKLIHSESSITSVLKVILKHALEISGAESAAIVIREPSGDLNVAAHQTVDEESWDAHVSHHFADAAILQDQVVESENAEKDSRFSGELSIRDHHIKSVICLPIHVRDQITGALYLEHRTKENAFQHIPKKVLTIFTDQIGIALDSVKHIEELSSESMKIKSQLDEMSDHLKHYEAMMDESVHGFVTKYNYENIIGRSKGMSDVLQTVDKIMDTDISVLITGESGTGKELVARALHFNSNRKDAEFVTINCGAIPGNLMESELFGYKAGAFTGAIQNKKGLFEEAHGGTIFLDEVTEIEPPLQAKLLRVIQEKELTRVGDTKPRSCDVRIISATNRDIDQELKEGRLREDLYWRICQLRLHLPPLRERKEDIPLLVKHFLRKEPGGKDKKMSPKLLKHFIEYAWPGNIRELENLISVLCALSEGETIEESCIPESYGIHKFITAGEGPKTEAVTAARIDDKNLYRTSLSWHDYENEIYAKAYQANNFKARAAARELGVAPTTMYNKIKQLGLEDRGNPLYKDPFQYTRGKTLKSYTFPVFRAALKSANNKALRAISKLGISQGFFYKVIKKETIPH